MARPLHELQVVRTEQVTPHITRVVLGGNGFDGFEANADTDSYAKLIFLPEGHEGPGPRDIDQARDMQATVRTYTIRSVDADRREIAIDFVVHGDTGVAGPWAARATAGDKLYLPTRTAPTRQIPPLTGICSPAMNRPSRRSPSPCKRFQRAPAPRCSSR